MPEHNPQGSFNINQLITNLRSKPLHMLMVAVVAVVALVVLVFALQLINSSFGALTRGAMNGPSGFVTSGISMGGYGGGGYAGESAYDMVAPSMAPMPPSGDYYYAEEGVKLSARNAASGISYPQPQPSGSVGDNAENYTVAQYSASIETRNLQDTCGSIAGLKPRTDVIFENANTADESCDFTFKVKHESVDEVLGIIKALHPRYLSENEYAIEQQVQDYTSAEDALKKQRDSIDETLAKATAAYDEVTSLATRSQNADALAKIINSKVNIIQQLTQQRVTINNQLEQLARSKAQQLDRVDYTYFNVNVTEIKFINGKQLWDSWKSALQNFVFDLNRVVQGTTLQFVLLLALVVQWALYALVALFVVKYGWKFGKCIWYR